MINEQFARKIIFPRNKHSYKCSSRLVTFSIPFAFVLKGPHKMHIDTHYLWKAHDTYHYVYKVPASFI